MPGQAQSEGAKRASKELGDWTAAPRGRCIRTAPFDLRQRSQCARLWRAVYEIARHCLTWAKNLFDLCFGPEDESNLLRLGRGALGEVLCLLDRS